MAGKGSLIGSGINAVVEAIQPTQNYSNVIHDLVTASALPVVFKAVVVDVIIDPISLTSDEWAKMQQRFPDDDEILNGMPKNSLIARIVNNGIDKKGNGESILYPFFPPHINFPIKPGEQVWVIFPNPDQDALGYWLSRVPEPATVDDLNFTHSDRKFRQEKYGTIEKAKQAERVKPGFANGAGTKETQTLAGTDAYDVIEKNAIANSVITKEPVPRFNKRPQDLMFQGSNNTLIVLGEDRTASALQKDKDSGAGTIDIVTGRSQRAIPNDESITPKGSAPHVVMNTRGYFETDKDVKASGKVPNVNEGDPDFSEDLSRVYVSSKTDGDRNFGLTFPPLNGRASIANRDDEPFIILKSDNVRIIARKDQAKGINGCIRIIKEGVSDTDKATIVLEQDGTIMIDGPKIILGSGISDQVYLGRDATEPAVLGEQLVQKLDQLADGISQFCQATMLAVGNLGAPIVQLNQASQMLDQEVIIFKNSIREILSSVNKVK